LTVALCLYIITTNAGGTSERSDLIDPNERRRPMKKGLIGSFVPAVMIAIAAAAFAGDDFGIPSYPGGRSDGETKEVCAAPDMGIIKERAEQSGLTTSKHCYRTTDPLAKVAAFYKKQKGLTGAVLIDEPETKSATFCRGECNEVSVGTSVALSAPWFVPSTMKMNNDLLIVITNRKK